MTRRVRSILAGLLIVGALGIWFGYLWFVSGVITSSEKYPDGARKAYGYLKRTGWGQYERHGHWTTHHPNGQKESDGMYVQGRKDGTWKYWDSSGREMTPEIYSKGELRSPVTTMPAAAGS